MYDVILCFITSFTLAFLALPSIIHIALKKGLHDPIDERRSHQTPIPSLGGMAIFAGSLFSIIFWTPFEYFGNLQYILCAFVIIALIGIKDDILPMSAKKKLMGQIISAAIVVFKANVMITNFHGTFGFGEVHPYISPILTIFVIIVIINAFNLIDGINGLSASIGILVCISLGTWFYFNDKIPLTIISYSLSGSLVAFLYYNVSPAKIFMGDTGSLLVGLFASILVIEFIESHKSMNLVYSFKSAPAFAVALLILPLYDTARVFTIRILRGRSPFSPDRNHIHHLLLDSGLSHMQATMTLVMITCAFILLAFAFQDFGNTILLFITLSVATILTYFLHINARRKRNLAAASV